HLREPEWRRDMGLGRIRTGIEERSAALSRDIRGVLWAVWRPRRHGGHGHADHLRLDRFDHRRRFRIGLAARLPTCSYHSPAQQRNQAPWQRQGDLGGGLPALDLLPFRRPTLPRDCATRRYLLLFASGTV